jgi:tetratricopeptide (TPR) repeat protein
MIETNKDIAEISLVEKGRALLDQGDVDSAVEYYGQAFDPESLDEHEARNMLIEARSHLSRKHLVEALESFEEALVMGTEIQRRQAVEGILTIAEIRSRLPRLTAALKKGLKERFGKKDMAVVGLFLMSDEENLVLFTNEALVMGTEIQRRQAVEGILTIAEIRSRLPRLTAALKKGLKERFGKKDMAVVGLFLMSDEENLVLFTNEALEPLPIHLNKTSRIGRIPQHVSDHKLPFKTDKCIAYTDEDDIRYILEIAGALNGKLQGKDD